MFVFFFLSVVVSFVSFFIGCTVLLASALLEPAMEGFVNIVICLAQLSLLFIGNTGGGSRWSACHSVLARSAHLQ